ncbi:MAG: DUF4870 domain-containing protein [Anaerolineae bacterium]|jgi:uncharacterized Tic20 family protein
MDNEQPSQDERIMAALAHGSVLMFGMGIVAAIVLWVTQKEKSRYVAFQALQAVAYHIAGLAIFLVVMGCWLALYFVSFIPLMTTPEESAGGALWIFLVTTFLMLVPFVQMGIWILGGWWGAVRALQGKDFRYVVIGRYLERWLGESTADQDASA